MENKDNGVALDHNRDISPDLIRQIMGAGCCFTKRDVLFIIFLKRIKKDIFRIRSGYTAIHQAFGPLIKSRTAKIKEVNILNRLFY